MRTGAVAALLIGATVPHGFGQDAAAAGPAEEQYAAVPETGRARFRPTAAERRVPKHFRMAAGVFPFETEYLRTSGPVRIYRVRFPSPVETEVPENNTVHGHYFLPPGDGPFPGVVVLHILGGDFPLSQAVANSLARKGIAALFIRLPYYGERRGRDSSRRMLSRNPGETVAAFTQAVLDIRRAAAWLGARPEVDEDQLGVTGISLGGVMSALAGAAEPRFGKVAIYLGGAKLPEAIWALDHPEAEEFRRQWLAAGGTRASFLTETAPIDPANYGHLLRGRRVLMVCAEHDEVIPPRCALALWESIGREPELVWLDAGHYSAALYLFGEMERLGAFFAPDEAEPANAP